VTVTEKKDNSLWKQFNSKMQELLAGLFGLSRLQLEDAATDMIIKHVTTDWYTTWGHVALRVGCKCHYIDYWITCLVMH
jgi:hypothetical protein